MNPYLLIIAASIAVIISFLFNRLSRKTRIPSVIMLMGLGAGMALVLNATGTEIPNLKEPLNIIGTIGLLLIVLEGALDLKITRDRMGTIVRACGAALVILLVTTFAIAFLIHYFLPCDFRQALIHAIPLSVVSSAIVIPSVRSLGPKKQEFLIYESTASDILGILMFNFIVFEPAFGEYMPTAFAGGLTILISVVLAIFLSYVLVVAMEKLEIKIKTFLFLSILALIYAAGKYFHLPTLIIVLLFGIILNNQPFFFRGRMKKFHTPGGEKGIREGFHLITQETSFLLRTFFFIFFGLVMSFERIIDPLVIIIGFGSVLIIYGIRFLNLKMISRLPIFPQILIAPRGLVTILLFFKIPEKDLIPEFQEEIMVFVIVISSLLMMAGLMVGGHNEEELKRRDDAG